MSENASGKNDSGVEDVLSFRQGNVYFMWHDGLKDKKRPHFHIILNKAPLEDDLICTAVITSHLNKIMELAKRDNYRPGTIVELDNEGYMDLDHPSAIDCNRLQEMDKKKFENYITQKKFLAEPHRDFPEDLLKKVLAGVEKSHLVEGYKRKLIF